MSIEIVPLDEMLVPEVKGLVAGYLNSSSNGTDESDPLPEHIRVCEQILERLLRSHLAHCYVAMHGNACVGFIVLSWSFSVSKGLPVLRIEALYSSSKHRNTGGGRALMQYAIDEAKEKKAARLQLETDDDNEPARSLYGNFGSPLIS